MSSEFKPCLIWRCELQMFNEKKELDTTSSFEYNGYLEEFKGTHKELKAFCLKMLKKEDIEEICFLKVTVFDVDEDSFSNQFSHASNVLGAYADWYQARFSNHSPNKSDHLTEEDPMFEGQEIGWLLNAR